ncbi:MAG: hypothetical protein JSR60_02140 [Proteobacteria bacterium]|nr:hypothetical protein [Pseudomonadota bacterium]
MDRETVSNDRGADAEGARQLPESVQAYLNADYATTGPLAKDLFDRAESEAVQDEISLSDVTGAAPAHMTAEMFSWYHANVAPRRNEAMRAVTHLYQDQAEQGHADGFALQLRIGTLDENLLVDKLKYYQDHAERFQVQSEDIKRTQAELMRKRQEYETKKAELGRDALALNWWLYLGVMVVVLFGSEAAINLESFEALPWATPAIAWGATILIGLAIGLAAHYHGTVYKQYGYYFDPSESDSKRGPAWRMIGGGALALSVSLSFIYYARSAYLTAYLGSVGDFGASSQETNFLWVVGGSLLGNILVYLTGMLWAYLLHDSDPDFPELKAEVVALDRKLTILKTALESARVRKLEQLNAAHAKAVETARRMSNLLSTQSRYRWPQEVLASVIRQDDAVVAILLAYRTKLTQRAAALGKKTRYIQFTDDPFSRQAIATATEFLRLPLKLKYLES